MASCNKRWRVPDVKTLILGYGNDSRRDDGVGWFVIERLEALPLNGVELLTAHQLEVDHAEVISRFDNVVFVDAAVPQSQKPITETVVQPRFQSHAVAHYLTPSDLVSLSDTLYGQVPRAALFSIRGIDFGFGTGLSSATEVWALEVVHRIEQRVKDWNQQPVGTQAVVGEIGPEQGHARNVNH